MALPFPLEEEGPAPGDTNGLNHPLEVDGRGGLYPMLLLPILDGVTSSKCFGHKRNSRMVVLKPLTHILVGRNEVICHPLFKYEDLVGRHEWAFRICHPTPQIYTWQHDSRIMKEQQTKEEMRNPSDSHQTTQKIFQDIRMSSRCL